MQPSPNVLPRSLRGVATDSGLFYPTHSGGQLIHPIACRRLPTFKDPIEAISAMPLQMNFKREVLDMDKEEDREEYNRIMNYWHAGYGMKIIYHERRFVKKVQTFARRKHRKIVQRIFIEYYAPYRVLTYVDS